MESPAEQTESLQGDDAKLFYRRAIGEFLEDKEEEYLLFAGNDVTKVDEIKKMTIATSIRLIVNLHKKPKNNGLS